jgi:DNA-directed RNA polymerase subunit M/transcription elongation factor TFIIS
MDNLKIYIQIFKNKMDLNDLNDENVKKIIREICTEQSISEKWVMSQIIFDLETKKKNKNYFEEVLLLKKLGFDHEIFLKVKKKYEEENNYLTQPIEVEEGVIQCHSCKSFRVFSITKQTRASDEPLTVFSQCINCKKRWMT